MPAEYGKNVQDLPNIPRLASIEQQRGMTFSRTLAVGVRVLGSVATLKPDYSEAAEAAPQTCRAQCSIVSRLCSSRSVW